MDLTLPQDIGDYGQASMDSPEASQTLMDLLRGQASSPQPAPQIPQPSPVDPQAKLRSLLQQQVGQTPQELLLEKLHMTKEEKDKRSKWGNVGQKAGNILQALALGRNFRGEAAEDYKNQTARIGQGNETLRIGDLAKSNEENRNLKDLINQRATEQKEAELAQRKVRDQNTKEIADRKAEIGDKLATGKLTQADAQALLNKAKASNIMENGGMSGEYALINRIASGEDPEKVARLAQALGLVEAGKGLSKLPVTGSSTSTSKSLDAAGNPVSNTSITLERADPMAMFQRMLGRSNAQINPLSQFGTPGFAGPGAPLTPGGQAAPNRPLSTPVSPIQHLQNNAAPPVVNDTIEDGFNPGKYVDPAKAQANAKGNIKTYNELVSGQSKMAKDAEAKYNLKSQSIETNGAQRASLAQAMIAGQDNKFQGFVPSLLERVRNTMTDITPAEGQQRALDFRSMYDNLSSNMKGAFKKQEIDQALNVQGSTKMTPQTALILHVTNELTQESQAAHLARTFVGKDGKPLVSSEEVARLAQNEGTRYLAEVQRRQEEAKKNPAIAQLPAPKLKTVNDLVREELTKKKLGLIPKSSAASKSELDKLRDELK